MKPIFFAFFAGIFGLNFVQAQHKNSKVVVHCLGDPDVLNPITSTSADAMFIQQQLFCSLLKYDYKTLQLLPSTAAALPITETLLAGKYKGGMSLTFEIQKQAAWDNGKPITAHDYIFTIKAAKNPKTNAGGRRRYLEFIDSIVVDKKNPKKFTIFSKEVYFLAAPIAGTLEILPEYIYDKKQTMRKFSISELNNPENNPRLLADKDIQEFADEFNSEKYASETIVGGGEYAFVAWKKNECVKLARKKNCWQDKLNNPKNKNSYPDSIIYKIIPDPATALTAAANGEIDVIPNLPVYLTPELQENEILKQQFNFHTPPQFAYLYIGLNLKNPILSDNAVRKAISHLVDRDWIVSDLYLNFAKKTNSPVSSEKSYYNKNLSDLVFNLDTASNLLRQAGWVDTDADGVLDKIIDGKKTQLAIAYKYNNGNNIRKSIGLALQESAAKIGIKIEVIGREWTVFLEDTQRRDFDLMSLAWVQSPSDDDFKQIWHSSSDTPEGSNRVGFNNAEADKLIDEIRQTLDKEKRYELYLKAQQLIVESHAYIFLVAPYERVLIHKKFKNTNTSSLRPNFEVNRFQLK